MVDRRWAIVIVVRPLDTLSKAACTIFSLRTSMELVASSRIRMLGCLTILRAIARRWRWPPLSLIPASPTGVS
jgi:hypothetical protein